MPKVFIVLTRPWWINYLGMWIWSTVDSGVDSVLKTERESRDGWGEERWVAESPGKTSQRKEQLPRAGQKIMSPDYEDLRGFDRFSLSYQDKAVIWSVSQNIFWFNSSWTVSDSFKKVKYVILRSPIFFPKKCIFYRLILYFVCFKIIRIFTGNRKKCHQKTTSAKGWQECWRSLEGKRRRLSKQNGLWHSVFWRGSCSVKKDPGAFHWMSQTWACPG